MKQIPIAVALFIMSLIILKGVFAQSPTATPHPTSVIGLDRLFQFTACQGLEKVALPDSVLKYLEWDDTCVTPTTIIIHFTGEWSDVDETITILNDRRLGCHIGTRGGDIVQMLDLFTDKVERAGCAAGYNNFAIHNEISGVEFDEVIDNPYHPRYDELVQSTESAVKSTCWIMEQYDIPATQVFGHHEITPDKPDPGPVYMEYFREQLSEGCL